MQYALLLVILTILVFELIINIINIYVEYKDSENWRAGLRVVETVAHVIAMVICIYILI